MEEYLVDVRCKVEANDLSEAYRLVEQELREYILNSDVIKEHDYMQVKILMDSFFD